MPDANTPSAVLTNKQREWLTSDESDLPAPSERALRSRIRERYPAALYDFGVLLEHWEKLTPHDREAIAAVNDTSPLAFLLATILYPETEQERQATLEEAKTGQFASEATRIEFVSRVLENALDRAAKERGVNRTFTVNISSEVDDRTVGKLKQQLRRGEITQDDVDELFKEGEIDRDKYLKVTTTVDEDEGGDK